MFSSQFCSVTMATVMSVAKRNNLKFTLSMKMTSLGSIAPFLSISRYWALSSGRGVALDVTMER